MFIQPPQITVQSASSRLAVTLLLLLALIGFLLQVQTSPIVSQHLGAPRHRRLRDPMPWEDSYFDPSYHAWPKSRQQQVGGDSKTVKLTSDESVSGKSAVTERAS